jgi:hypothetical protein
MNPLESRVPEPDLYCVACDKQSGDIIAIGMSAQGALDDASEKTGLPKDCFVLHNVSLEEYEGCCETGGQAL